MEDATRQTVCLRKALPYVCGVSARLAATFTPLHSTLLYATFALSKIHAIDSTHMTL